MHLLKLKEETIVFCMNISLLAGHTNKRSIRFLTKFDQDPFSADAHKLF